MNYFMHDERALSPAYVASCRKFLKELSAKQQAASVKLDKVIIELEFNQTPSQEDVYDYLNALMNDGCLDWYVEEEDTLEVEK